MNVKHAIALLCLATVSCGASNEKKTLSDEETPEVDVHQDAPPSNGRHPCDERDVVTFEIDGGKITFNLPTLCDPMPYVEKGDPPWKNPKDKPPTVDPSTPTSR